MPKANDRNEIYWGECFSEHRIFHGDESEANKPDRDPNGLWRHLCGRFVGGREPKNFTSVYGLLRPEFFIELERKRQKLDQDLDAQGIEEGPDRFGLELRADLSLDIVLMGSAERLGLLEGTPGEVAEIARS